MKKATLFLSFMILTFNQSFTNEYSIKEELRNLPYIEMNRIDRLRSSVDKTGNNADDDSNLGIEGDRAIVFDSYGPGETFRIWRSDAHSGDSLFFYFDGEAEPSLAVNQFEMFFGVYDEAKYPISYDYLRGSGGAFSYARIRYNKSLKILKNSTRKSYYQIDYAEYDSEVNFENGFYSPQEELSIFDGKVGWTNLETNQIDDFAASEISSSMSHAFTFDNSKKTRINKLELNIDDLVVGDSLDRIYGWLQAYKGSSSFNMELKHNAQAILLTKRVDPKAGTIPTEVFIDGRSAATFSGVDWNYNYRFANDTVYIPGDFITGKSKINITIKPINPDVVANESYFSIIELKDNKRLLGDETSVYWWEGGKEHRYQVEEQIWVGPVQFSYKPRFNLNTARNSEILKNTYIKIYFDGKKEPSINAPLGLFFGNSSYDAVRSNSLVSGIDSNGTFFTNFPMIFNEDCKIEIENRGSSSISNIDLKIYYEDETSKERFGYLTAIYNEAFPSIGFVDYDFARVSGSGKFIGVVYETDMEQAYEYAHLEGDERFVIDDMAYPLHHGTGTEDYFNGAFYFVNGPFESPFAGQIFVDSVKRTIFRWQIFDSYNFLRNGRFSMEHGTNNTALANHRSLAFFYLNDTTLIHTTDSLTMGNALDIARTNYEFEGSFQIDSLYSAYLNEDFYLPKGRLKNQHQGIVSFDAKIFPNNEGIRIQREFDDSVANQKADVYIDNELVGIWHSAGGNPFIRLREDIFDVPSSFTKDKDKIRIKLVPRFYGTYNEIKYKVLTKGIKPVVTSVSTKNNNNIKIYPNPAKDYLNIRLSKSEGNMEYKIIDIRGKLWIKNTTSTSENIIDIEDLPVGSYFLIINGSSTNFIKI